MSMLCYQCEQTAKGTGCTAGGVCGKSPEVAALQDLLIHAVKGIAMYAHRAAQLGANDNEIDRFALEAAFATLTNVDFDPARFQGLLTRAAALRDKAKALYTVACRSAGETPEELAGPAAWAPAADLDGLIRQGEAVSIQGRIARLGEDVTGLQELIVYGVKGAAAYADHAAILGKEDDDLYALLHELLDFVAGEPTDGDALLANAFETDVNGLPLSFILSWYEQKAVAILLTLLSLGVQNIRLGPGLPAFVTPPVLNVLVEKFSIAPVTTPQEDLQAILA